jgi:DNA gyrase/topoisomerase IV subunit A
MKAVIETEKGLSTLKLEIDFNQLVSDNFAEVCKAIAIRRNAFKELLTNQEANENIVESIVKTIRHSNDESDAVRNLCRELNFSPETAQYVTNMSLEDFSSINTKNLKRLLDNHTEEMNKLLY